MNYSAPPPLSRVVLPFIVGFAVLNGCVLPTHAQDAADAEAATGQGGGVSGRTDAPAPAEANDTARREADGRVASEAAGDYTPALELLPATAAGVVRMPSLPSFCVAWDQTNYGKLIDDPLLQPFIEAQREKTKQYWDSLDTKVGLRPQDLYDIASGEVVAAWLPFPKDQRRPFAVCVVADIRGSEEETEAALAQIDADLAAQGATRNDVEHRGQVIRVYSRKPKPGQIKIEEIVLTSDDTRIIAADRESVVFELLDAIAGEAEGARMDSVETYQTVLSRSYQSLSQDVAEAGGTVAIEWFARPFEMGRILRELFEVDRGNETDILKLLENQGFDAIQAAGGVLAMNLGPYDLLHRGYVLAPPTAEGPERYKLGARMLSFPNTPVEQLPAWVGPDTGVFTRLRWELEKAFWAAETVVDEALGVEGEEEEGIFQDLIEGIREDEEGPQIDIPKNVLPNLDDEVIVISGNALPADVDSERMLVAIRVRNPAVIKEVVRKGMVVEPNVSQIDTVPGTKIWVVDQERVQQDFEPEIFKDFNFPEEDEADQPPPLLNRWAIALVDQGPGSEAPYLMFSSDPDLLVATAQRVKQPAADGFAAVDGVKQTIEAMKQLGAQEVALTQIVRPELSLRIKYELLRRGELKNLDSLGASLIRRILNDEDDPDAESFSGEKLPPLQEIEHYLQPGGSFIRSTDDGWSMNGFILK